MIAIAEHFRKREELGNQFFHIRGITLTVLPGDRDGVEGSIRMIEFALL